MTTPAHTSRPRAHGRRFFVSRHPGAIAWAKRHPWGVRAIYVKHLDLTDVRNGDIVIGTLPIHLVAEVCARGGLYLHLMLNLQLEQRGAELSEEELDAAGARLIRYSARQEMVPRELG